MKKNIEFKVRIGDFKGIIRLLKKKKTKFAGILHQRDIYYHSANARLKLRIINNKQFEVIYYQRANKFGSKISQYKIVELNRKQFEGIKNIFSNILRHKLTIEKKRLLWIYKHTRIHLDHINKLGNFLELETVIGRQSLIKARREHQEIIGLLNIGNFKKVSIGYSDMSPQNTKIPKY